MQKLLFQLDEFAEYLQTEALTISQLQNKTPPLLQQPQEDQQSQLNTVHSKIDFLQSTTKILFDFLKEELMELAVQLQKELTRENSQSELWQCINFLKGRQGQLQSKLEEKTQQVSRLKRERKEDAQTREQVQETRLRLEEQKINKEKASMELERVNKIYSAQTLTLKQLSYQNKACKKQLQSALLLEHSLKSLQLQNESLSKANQELSQRLGQCQLKIQKRQHMDQELVRQAIQQAVQRKQQQLQQRMSQTALLTRLSRVIP